MSNSDSREINFGEHTFGRDHFSPPPLSSEFSMQSETQAASLNAPLPDDFDQRIRSIGEW